MNTVLDKMKQFLDKGVDVSKEALKKAVVTVQDLGSKGVKKVEIFQLENQFKNELSILGTQLYAAFKDGEDNISMTDGRIEGVLKELDRLAVEIEERKKAEPAEENVEDAVITDITDTSNKE